jgi:membrane associated rhomboid family serine protease
MLPSSLQKVLPRPESGSKAPAPLTLLICVVAVVITVGINAESAQSSWDQMAKWGYLPAERVWDGALWALISSAFVHMALWHLVFNLYWMWHLGGAVERELGSVKYLVLVLALAFVSSAYQLAVSSHTGFGASGIVYGLFGLMWRSKEQVRRYADVLGAETPAAFFIWLVACWVATYAGFANIGNGAHIAGLAMGVLLAEWRIRGRYRRVAGAAAVLLSGLGLVATYTNPWSVEWLEHHAMKMHRARQYEIAAVTYERSLSFGSDSAWAFHNLALAYYSMGDSTRCAEALRRLRAKAPTEADSLERRLFGADVSFRGNH